MKKSIALLLFIVTPFLLHCQSAGNEIIIKKTNDFDVSGSGKAKNWESTSWLTIPQRTGESLSTKIKILYSGTGIYFLFDCGDKKLTSTMNADFLDLWKEDVVEIFLWTDESSPVYFEYEISPLDFELPLLISNENGELLRWQPFHYEPNRKTRHSTSVRGGEKKSLSTVSGWMAEFFIPYTLMRPLDNNIPKSGTKWRANMYRVDYDATTTSSWSWQPVNKTFHDYKKFGTYIFE